MNRGYQYEVSSTRLTWRYRREGRERKARTMALVLRDFLGRRLATASVLDVGAAAGFIDHYLAAHVARVIGIDIDADAIRHAQQNCVAPNLRFQVGDAMDLDFPDESFDVVLCTNVYEHVPDARRLMAEIRRVLRPGGVCYFAAGNRLNPIERHYRLPFLSVLPRPLAHLYLRGAGRGASYYEKHLSYWGLKRLVRGFRVHDYSRRIVIAPEAFGADYMLPPRSWKRRLASLVVRHAYWLCPSYVWVLESDLSHIEPRVPGAPRGGR
jgi:SAM-dependent methyltransferase